MGTYPRFPAFASFSARSSGKKINTNWDSARSSRAHLPYSPYINHLTLGVAVCIAHQLTPLSESSPFQLQLTCVFVFFCFVWFFPEVFA